jgi:hypothetical protein
MAFEVLAFFSNTHHLFCCLSFFSHIILLTILSNYQIFIGSTSFNNLHGILLDKILLFNLLCGSICFSHGHKNYCD